MKALDTNVIIRFLVQDDEAQSKAVFKLSDILIAHSAKNSGCATTLTFDKNTSKFKLFARLDIDKS